MLQPHHPITGDVVGFMATCGKEVREEFEALQELALWQFALRQSFFMYLFDHAGIFVFVGA